MKKCLIILIFSLVMANMATAQTWNEQLVNAGTIVGPENIAYDNLGNPAVLFKQGNNILFTYWNGQSWNTVDHGSSSWGRTGLIHIDTVFYVHHGNGNFYRVSNKGKTISYIPVAKTIGAVSSIGSNNSDKIYLVSNAQNYLSINELNLNTEVWSPTIYIDQSTDIRGVDVDVAQDGRVWIAYKAQYGNNLKVALSRTSNIEGAWDIWFVDTEGDVGDYAQIYVDDSNVAHVVYYDATNQKLKYARFNP